MTRAQLFTRDWQVIVDRLGGAAAIGAGARQTKAFLRARGIASAVDPGLRRGRLCCVWFWLIAWRGLRSTAAWASAIAAIGWPGWSAGRWAVRRPRRQAAA